MPRTRPPTPRGRPIRSASSPTRPAGHAERGWRSSRPTTTAPAAWAAEVNPPVSTGETVICARAARTTEATPDGDGHARPRARPRRAAGAHAGPLRLGRHRGRLDSRPGLPGRRRPRPVGPDGYGDPIVMIRPLRRRRARPRAPGPRSRRPWRRPGSRAAARRADRTRRPGQDRAAHAHVALVKRLGSARIYARRSAVRRGLAPTAGEAALAVTCPLECRLDSRVRARSPARRSARLDAHEPAWDGGTRATHAQSRRPPASGESRRLRGLGDHGAAPPGAGRCGCAALSG